MLTIKGLITLLLVAAAVFTVVVIYNGKTEPEYEAKLKAATLANTVKIVKQTAIRKTASAGAHQKIKKTNL